jgi:pimeloyl-ACP methyl ester carboxylesterase
VASEPQGTQTSGDLRVGWGAGRRPARRLRHDEAVESFSRAGLTFDVRDGGPSDGPVVILLHGFPETSSCWDRVVGGLHEGGFRTLAPDQRGYSPRARPKGRRDYAVAELVADVICLADTAGAERFHLVGHDWGGIIAWYLAARHPERLTTMSSLSTPHPAAFQASLLRSTQAMKSYYMLAFQIPALPEFAMMSGDGRGLRRALRKSGLADELVDQYLAALRHPGALTAALNYYRALPLGGRSAVRCGDITVPALYVWSTKDVALGRTAAELTARHVTAPYRFEILDGVSHWIPEEAPEAVTSLLLEHLGGH